MSHPSLVPIGLWESVLADSLTYERWLERIDQPHHREELVHNRLAVVIPEGSRAWLRQISRTVHVLAIAEGWCSDVRRHVPALQRLSDFSSRIQIRFVDRDVGAEILSRHHIHGDDAIPAFIVLSDRFAVCGSWGPMPESCRRIIARGKAADDPLTARKLVQAHYAADPAHRETVRELLDLIELATATTVQPGS